ncbi:lysophospholipid acyltransferase family protein [Nocardia jejuensis]|uniref:lysophospholipid acyltransferase family protein n=1 Tax=Nocardia jejuensis TaxID=328049 RepID=UPI0008295E5C|nr:lysophospholipid acyltransferase family protein [Nocardia jejuensis]
MPSSPCGPECVDTTAEAGDLRVAARVLGLAGVVASFPLVHFATPRRRRAALHARYARALLACCGIRVRIVDNMVAADPASGEKPKARSGFGESANAGVLVVAGHIGWTDVIALSAVEPLGFVARADLIDWPVLGAVARKVRVIPIERERLRQLPAVVRQIATRLSAGERVAIFPEGTTWCGRGYGRMRPALFQAAIDTGTPVQPLQLRYVDRHGELSTVPGFVGNDSMADSIGRILRSKGVVAEIVLQPLEQPGTDRHELARRCERAVRGDSTNRAFAGLVHRLEQGPTVTDATRSPARQPEVAETPIAMAEAK